MGATPCFLLFLLPISNPYIQGPELPFSNNSSQNHYTQFILQSPLDINQQIHYNIDHANLNIRIVTGTT